MPERRTPRGLGPRTVIVRGTIRCRVPVYVVRIDSERTGSHGWQVRVRGTGFKLFSDADYGGVRASLREASAYRYMLHPFEEQLPRPRARLFEREYVSKVNRTGTPGVLWFRSVTSDGEPGQQIVVVAQAGGSPQMRRYRRCGVDEFPRLKDALFAWARAERKKLAREYVQLQEF